jgi:ectoine hydroxylase-related dioxygenase (phytanoyl-CoA dioxygenase family)
MTKLTLITHIFNEEYLLPFWLSYHKDIFSDGYIIDYYSTDRSVEIINKICPTWKIIKTKNIDINGKLIFQSDLIDIEVIEIEKTVNGYKICLNTTEFLFIKNNLILSEEIYSIYAYSVVCNIHKQKYPKNFKEFLQLIEYITPDNKLRGCRYIHNKKYLNYQPGRHLVYDIDTIKPNENLFIIHFANLFINKEMFKRRLQIKYNISDIDKIINAGFQHQVSILDLFDLIKKMIPEMKNINDEQFIFFKNIIDNYKSNIYYPHLYLNSNWGNDEIILEKDVNLLEKTNFDNKGYEIFKMNNYNIFLKTFLEKNIKKIINKDIKLENYHNLINEEEHKQIINNMPYKKNEDSELKDFCIYLENFISDKLNQKVIIFNDDIWFRICRPSILSNNDYNPCHKDIYLDFYRNVINIYLPIIGSNENSALKLAKSSHKINEKDLRVTKNGAYFEYENKKYSVDAIVASKEYIEMIRPDPKEKENEIMIFSPYLIHGCSDNLNNDITRVSLEVRFIRDDNNSKKQIQEFNEFLSKRNWR